MKEVSIYHEYDHSDLIAEVKESVKAWSADSPDGFGGLGKSILYSLYKYRALNRKNIEKCVSLKERNTWKEKNVKVVLLMLRKANLIKARGFKNIGDENYRIILYYLTPDGFEEVKKFKDNAQETSLLNDEDTSLMLRIASVNQWHISILYSYGRNIKASIYNNFSIRGGDTVPSVTQITKDGETITIFAFIAPKKEEEIKPFLLEVLKLESYLISAKQYRPCLIVAISESSKLCSWLAWRVNKYRETRPLKLVYSLDYITQLEEPLRYLQLCNADEWGMNRLNLNLI